MKVAVAAPSLAVLVLAYCGNLGAQSLVPASVGNSPAAVPRNFLSVPTGETLVLELKSPLNSRSTRKGDHADFSTTTEILVGNQVVIPRGTTVRATVTQAKRAGPLGKARIQLEFNEIVLPDGTVQPLSANLIRTAWSKPKAEYGKAHGLHTIMSNAAAGAVMGVIFEGRRGAVRGATAGAAIGAIGVLTQHGPDLDFPPGMMFEIELAKPLDVPVAALARSPVAASHSPLSSPSGSSRMEYPKDDVPSRANPAELPAGANPHATSDSQSNDSTTLATNRTPLPPAPTTPVSPVGTSRGTGELVGFKLKVDVDLVVVEATVRDEHGGIVDNLKRENFHLFEDGIEQEISHFSRDELPLAVALVVDRSGSMAPVLNELRRAAYDTLSLLKPDDQVALFAFAATAERLEYLTTDRQRIADDLAGIRAGGGTNITDALFDAALYLGRAAPNRRHAVILVSDNEGTVPGYASEKDVIRLTLETETVIYSIKIGEGTRSRMLSLSLPILGTGSVPKIARQTGGEVIDANNLGSVRSAMATVISRLKQRYSLGYHSTNRRRDGNFRKIEIRITDPYSTSRGKYTVYARPGYYARAEHAASRSPQP